MRKIAKKTALLLSLTALAAASAAFGVAADERRQTVYAQTVTARNATDETALIAPGSYQQYLSLDNPMDVAATSDYMAIADNNFIYVYDVQEDVYRKYEHTLNQTDPTKNNIMELQFYGEDKLYFLDGTYLYLLNPETLQVSDVSITENHPKFPCSSFLIVDDVLYYTDVKTQASVSYITLDGTQADTLSTVDSKPTIAFWNGEVYYTEAAKYLCKIDPQTKKYSQVASFPEEIVSMQIQNDVFVCTTLSGDFYAYNLAELSTTHSASETTPLAHYQGDYASLSFLGDHAYVVNGSSVCQYSLESSSFTDFEICNVSNSIHRLDNATETLLTNGLLYISDNGNNRVSVYDTATQAFKTPIPLNFSPKHLAGDGKTLLAADDTQAVLYDLTSQNYGNPITVFDSFNGTLIGAVNVYGTYYFATDSNHYYAAAAATDENGTDIWTVTESKKTSTRYAKLLTADAYGYLYVASGSGVYRFSEEEFLSITADGASLGVTLPTNTQKILVDYNGDVYALADGKVHKATEDIPYALNEPLVYSESATVQSFAFGIEDNVTYVLYRENYLTKTTLFHLPTVKNIPVNGVDEGIFNDSAATVEIVCVNDGAMLIDFDLTALFGAEVFPYLDYSRSQTVLTALKIGETTNGKHAAVVFYDEQAHAYRSCLALINDCSVLTEEEQAECYVPYPQAEIMYVSNDVPVYKFPHLSDLPTLTTLTRNTKIDVLGEVNGLKLSYYLVQYTDGDGATHTGYVPKVYAIDFTPTPPTVHTNVYGEKESTNDDTRRLIFLILGGAAILILTDVLIFRFMKKKKDD